MFRAFSARVSGRVFTSALLAGAAVLLPPSAARAEGISVPAGGDLQAALNAAQPGDTILLEAGATFVGKFTLPPKDNPSGLYITVRSAAPDAQLPAPGVRITPAYAPVLPKIRSSDTMQGVYAPPGASYWRLQFLELQANVDGAGDIIRIGSWSETIAANQPHHIVLDQIYVHGDPAIGQKNGVVAHAREFQLLNSYVSDIKLVGIETHAFVSYNGPGPYLVENNYLEAAGINVLIGGADPKSPDLVPSNLTFRRNHMTKNTEWMKPRPDGKYWTVKNLFELKLGRGVLVEGNLLEHNWFGTSDQQGYAVLMRTENQEGACSWCETGNVLFQNNHVRRSPAGLNLLGLDYPSGGSPDGIRMHDVTFRNNLFSEIDVNTWYVGSTKSGAKFALLSAVDRLTLDHNTIVMGAQSGVLYFHGAADGSPGFTYTNNMSEHKTYGVKGDSQAVGTTTLEYYTENYLFTKNVLAEAGTYSTKYPPGNEFPSATAWQSEFVDYAAGNYRLKETSLYKGAGTDGEDLGANIDAIEAAIAGGNANTAPVANSGTSSTDEDTPVAIVLTATDADGDPLTFTIATQPSSGTLSGTAPKVTYAPHADFHGSDSFTFAVSDGRGGTSTGRIDLTVAPVNDAPAAADQSVRTAWDTTLTFAVTATDVDGDLLQFAVTASPSTGTLVQGEAGTFSYTPVSGSEYSTTFSYSATDPDGLTDTGVVTIQVTRPSNPPVANDQQATLNEDESAAVTLSASDPDGDTLTYSVGSPQNGRLSGVAPALTYTPNPNWNGTDSFSYRVSDPTGAWDEAIVTLQVTAVNDPPQADDSQTATTTAGGSVDIVLQATDVDNPVLAFTITRLPNYGTLSGTAPNLTYTAGAGFVGTDSFTYTASDGAISDPGTVTITVTGDVVTVTTTSLRTGKVGRRYRQELKASGGATPYSWSIVAGGLPSGLALTSSTGEIRGTPTNAGSYEFTVRVRDAWGMADDQGLSIRITESR